MSFEDLIVGADTTDETPSFVAPDLIQTRAERKGMATDFSARRRAPVDFGADDEVVGPAPKVRRSKAVSFGDDDEVIGDAPVKSTPLPLARPAEADAISGTVPTPRARPAEAPGLIQPTQPIPDVQPLEDAGRFRVPGRSEAAGSQENMLTGDEAFAERDANIKAAEEAIPAARDRLEAAKARSAEIADGSGRAQRRGTTGDLQRQAILAEVDSATQNLAMAERALSEANRASPPTQTKLRDAASRAAAAVGTIVPDTVGGLARPVDAALDALGIKDGTGTAEKMREFSKNISKANQADPTREEEFSAKMGQGAGSAIGFVVTGAIGKAAGGSAALTSAVTGGAQNAEQYYREADDMGASAKKKALAYIAGGAIGATEGVGLGRMADVIEGMDKATGGAVRRYLGLILKEAGEEGLQEGVQQLADNIAKYGLYGKDPGDITKDVASNALVGAMLGMGMAGIAGSPTLLTRGRAAERGVPVPDQQQVSPEEIVRQVLGEPSTPPMAGPTPAMPPAEGKSPGIMPQESPVPAAKEEETARFYHGGKYGEESGPTDGMPKWLTPNETYARDYKSDGKPNEVYYVDIPKSKVPPDGFDDINGYYRHFDAPAAIAKQLKPLANKPPAAAEVKAAQDETTALLRGYGYTGDQIADMSPNQREQEAAAAKEAGTEPAFGHDDHVVGSRTAPVEVKTPDDLKHATDLIEKDYTPAQGEANNRKLGHITWNGLKASLEVEPGGTRRGTNPKTGEAWETKNGPAAYGYFPGFKGADGQDIDLFFGKHPKSKTAYVIDELDQATGKFRQTKVMGAFASEQEARDAYLGTSSKSDKTLGAITPATIEQLIEWLHNGDLKAPYLKTKPITLPKETKSDKPLSLLQFIASKGGLSPDPELSAIGLTGGKRMQIPGRKGFFSPMRPAGMNLDQMREAAQEAGYFRGTGEATSTVREFLDAIDGELRGQRKMAEGHEAEPSQGQTDRVAEENANRDATLDQHRTEIEAMLAQFGQPASLNREEDIRLAAEIMADEGLGPDEALERAAMRNLETDMPVTAEEIHDTFDFGAFDAVQPGPTQKDERAAADESAVGKRPGEEGRPAEAVGHVPDAGEDRQGPGKGEAAEEAGRAEGPGKEVSGEVAAPPTEKGADNKDQLVLPGAEKESDGTQAQRKADKPLKPKVAQKKADEGLFGDEKDQSDLLDVKPQDAPKIDADVTAAFDAAFDELDQAEKPKAPPRTAAKVAKSAARNAAKGTASSIKALGELFGGNKLSEGITFDDETYAKAKPLFLQAAGEFKDAFKDVGELARILLRELRAAGYGVEVLRNTRPYLEQFVQDVKSGKIDLSESDNERLGTDRAGAEALDGAPAEQGEAASSRGSAEPGTPERSDVGAGGDRNPAEEGVSGARSAGSGAADVHPAETRTGTGRRTRRTGSRVSAQSPGGSADESGRGPSDQVTPAEAPNLPGLNYRITDETELGQGSEGVKFRDNIAAIETLKTLEREQRRATPAEQRTLARYVGWGGIANAFRDTEGNLKTDWQERGERLESLLTKDEMSAARRSTRNAHYTSRTVVDTMWQAAQRLGFKGGLALELSSGTGNFLGLVPEEIAGQTRFVAVEYDSLTARIAKALYPQDTVLHSGLHKLPLPEGEAVLNIGNPPFGAESLRFQYQPELNGLSIHNQFFLAGLDALRPGGLQILVVSRYLMDAQDKTAREMIAKKAKLLGAIRLPDTAFKENARTEVVTDIIFLQRHTASEEEAMAAEFEKARDPKKESDIPSWVETGTVKDPAGGEPMVVNQYFATNRSMVMGTLDRSGTMRGRDEVNVTLPKGADLAGMLKKAVDRLPRDVMDLHQDVMDATLARHKSMGESLAIALSGHEVGHVEREDGKLTQISELETPTGGYEPVKREVTAETPWSRDLYMDSGGQWYTLEPKVDDKGAKVKSGARNVYERKYFENNEVPATRRLGQARFDKLSDLVALRDLTKGQLVLEAQDAPAAEMEANRKDLAKAYESYVAANGYLNEANNLRLLNDLPDGALVLALETSYRAPITHTKAKRTGQEAKPASAKPAPIMSRRVVPKYEPATKADSPSDALFITLSESGYPDIDRIAGLLGVSREAAIEQMTAGANPLLYKDPETGGFDTANGYLSGNVVRKLKAAEAAGMNQNAEALRKVQPERWSAENISAMLGANWITPQVYADFAKHLFGVGARVHYSQVTNSFNLFVDEYPREKADQWGTADVSADAILRGMLNSRVPKVIRRDDERTWVDQEATALVSLKAKEIENEFADWVFADTARRNVLTDIFNEKFNTRVNRQHDGTHLTLPGKVPDEVIKLRRHQKNAVWRGIYERFMLLDHVVGAGKTFTAIARAMERRRMGLSRKPMVVVPNHLVDQWTADVYRLYPGAKVLAAGKNQFEKRGRRRLFAKIATGDWDIVIVPHSSFGFIGIAPETESRYLEEELRLALEAVQEAKEQAAAEGIGGRGKPFTVKEAERLVTTIEGRMDKLKKVGRDNMLTFEQMGVDDLTVDEAHEFKNLFYSSRLTGVRGMGDKSGSQKAFDLYNKVRVLRDGPTGTVTFMTGTPISNSAVEMYTMMRYLSAKDLADLGIEHFDAWRSQYVSATAKFEPTEAGGLKEVTRLGRNWSNMRALMELYYSFTDAVSQEDINKWYAEDNEGARFPVPKVKHGGRKEVVVKPTEAQSGLLSGIVAGFNGLPSISDPVERNATRLRLMDRARKVSLDARAADPSLSTSEKGGKLEQIADKIAGIHKATKVDAGTQLVFIDRSVPSAKSDKKVIKDYDDLIAKRDEALAAGDERKYRDMVEALDHFDANEIETLRAAQAGGWNAYDQLKKNLIARGVPADEIRFVQEANNDAEKKAIFDAVNDGAIRVLIGSTPRMGAGTNVQERLVALHHGDVTWKPSDIEQREGRIIRQGNKLLEKYGADNFEVDILAYVTERTVDAKMWDLNATKLKMINGIRKYDGAFNMEFEDEDSVGMAEIAALASGDPLLLERVKLMSEIDKLELLERAYRRKMFGVEDAIHDLERAETQYPAMIEAGRAKARQINEAISTMRHDASGRAVDVEGKSFTSRLAANEAVEKAIEAAKAGDENARYTISVNGQRVTNKETAEAILNQEIGDALYIEATIGGEVLRSRSTIGKVLAQKATEILHAPLSKFEPIGKMLGYHLTLGIYPDVHKLSLTLTDGATTMVDVEQNYAKDSKGFVPQTARALFDKLETEIEYESEFTGRRLQDRIDEAKTRLPSLRAERGKPFAKAEELKVFRDRLEDVIRTLDQRTKEAEGNRTETLPEAAEASLAKITGEPGAQPNITPEKRAAVEAALNDVVRKIAGPSVQVKFMDRINLEGGAPPAWGSYGDGVTTAAGAYVRAESLIYVAMADPAYPLKQTLETTFHEAFHHLEDKLLSPQEMEVLKREDGRLREIVKRTFGFTDAELKEIAPHEIRAMAFEYFANRRARGLEPQGLHIGIRRAFERLMDMFRRVRNALAGLGYQNADDILRSAADGAYANRTPVEGGRGWQTNIRQVRPEGNLNRFESYEPLPERWQDWWKQPDLNWRDRLWGMIDAAFLTSNRALGDRYVDMRRMQAAVELTGRPVNEGINMSLAAVLFEGKTEKRLKDYWQKTWKPVLDFARELGVSREEVHRYLYARHAPERNAHIARINPAMPEGGSGMTDAEAHEIMDAFAAAGKREALERVAQRVDGIVRGIRQSMVADQLEHEETIAKWEETYPHYAPLRGFESGDEDLAQELQAPRPGRGFDVRGPETKAALGRSSKADDILSNLFLMGERTIIRGEQNRVGRTAMRFMQSNPQPSMYDVSRSERILSDSSPETITESDIDLLLGERPITIQRINRETGLVENVTRVASPMAQNSFAVKVGGHTYYITIKHPGLLTALKNVGIQRLPWLIQAHGWLTRQFAAFRTARNPDFFVPNLFRDVQDAAYTLGAEQRGSLVKNFAANIATLRTYVAAFMGEMMEREGRVGDFARRKFADSPKARLFEDWKKNGGQIAFMGISDMDAARKEIEAAFNEGKEGIVKRTLLAGPRAARALLRAIEFFNAAIEGGTRLAVYDAGLKAGMTKAKAAELSKESTTNFNRKGIYSPYLNSFYAFFNARVQGATKIVRLLRTSKIARRAALGLVMGGFTTTLWNLAVSPDDEEKKPEYLRRKYWERERYFIIYMPGSKEPLRMPMGYGLQLFWMLGENMAMLSQGKITPAQAAANYLSTIVGAFSPLQAEGSATDPGTWLRLIIPSIEMPALELTTNEDWRRKPIHPKFEQKGVPHSQQHFTTTSPYAIEVAQFLNRVTGGDAFRRGKLDVYPGDLQYVWNFVAGGLGQTVNRTQTGLKNWAVGVPTPSNQIPILRHFVGANVEQTVGESYYEDRDSIQKDMASVRKAMKADINGPKGDDAADTIGDLGGKLGVEQGKKKGSVTSQAEKIFRDADKELKDLREQERSARADASMPRAAREQLIKDVRENMRQVQEDARRYYREMKSKAEAF